MQTTTIVDHGTYVNRYKLDYTQLAGKTIKSFVSGHGYNDKPNPQNAYDVTITFTDGTEVFLDLVGEGDIDISYEGE